jgi:hypothetical protein
MNNIKEILKVNMVIKNYKELCKLLNLEVVSGNSKKAQLNNLERYFKNKKDGNKYIITEIYNKPLEKLHDKSKGNNSIYITYIESLLLKLLSNQKKQTLVCTKNYLLVALGIVDVKYIDKNCQNKIAKIKEFKDYEMNEFNNRAYQTLDRILFSSLKNLKRRCLITFEEELHYTKINENTGVSYEDNVTEDEFRKYTSLKRATLDEMEIDNLRDVYFYHKTKDFYDILRDKLYDEFQWDSSFMCYRIVFTKDDVVRYIPKVEEELKQKLELNDKIVVALNNNAQTRYDNMVAKFKKEYDELCLINNCDYIPHDIVQAYLPPKNYVDRQIEITEEIIRINKVNKKVVR